MKKPFLIKEGQTVAKNIFEGPATTDVALFMAGAGPATRLAAAAGEVIVNGVREGVRLGGDMRDFARKK